MEIIDRTTRGFIEAEDAYTQNMVQEMEQPSLKSQDKGAPVVRRRRTEEITYFLKTNTLATLERLHNIAMDNVYSRDNEGNKIRINVPVGVQLQAANAFLDRSMGKPQINVDLTSGDRPIVFDQAFNAPMLLAGQGSTETIEDVESIDTGNE